MATAVTRRVPWACTSASVPSTSEASKLIRCSQPRSSGFTGAAATTAVTSTSRTGSRPGALVRPRPAAGGPLNVAPRAKAVSRHEGTGRGAVLRAGRRPAGAGAGVPRRLDRAERGAQQRPEAAGRDQPRRDDRDPDPEFLAHDAGGERASRQGTPGYEAVDRGGLGAHGRRGRELAERDRVDRKAPLPKA